MNETNETIIIIGAGFAGLFTALLLKLKSPQINVIIIEKNKNAGGKVATEKIDKETYVDLGPSVFHTNQANMMFLIDRYDLETIKLEKDIVEKFVSIKNCKTNVNKKVNQVIDTSRLRTGDEIAQMDYSAWVANFVLADDADVRRLKHGYKELINCMKKELLESKVNFVFNVSVTSIQRMENTDVIINTYEKALPFVAKNIIVCTSIEDIPRFSNILFNDSFFEIVKNSFSESTLRIVVQLNKALPENFARDHFDHYSSFRWALRGPREDILILCYVDGNQARNRFTEDEKIREIFIRNCLNELNLFNFNVVKTFWAEWPTAFTVIGASNDKQYNEMHVISNNIFTTCLPAASMQAWIEGGFISAVKCIESIFEQES
jgi:protoporphyrinogen oxidase